MRSGAYSTYTHRRASTRAGDPHPVCVCVCVCVCACVCVDLRSIVPNKLSLFVSNQLFLSTKKNSVRVL
jgi:hypothetical protein